MFIELNDKQGSIINLSMVASIHFNDKYKRIEILYHGMRYSDHFEYDTAAMMFNDKHRIKNELQI